MKISCRIIEDILPLYHDGVCSEESKAMVEEHLKECPDCKSFLMGIDSEIKIPVDASEAEPLKELKRTWNKQKILARLAGFACVAAVCGMLAAVFVWLTTGCFSPFSSEEITVSTVCQLENGDIFYSATVQWIDGWGKFRSILTEDGKFYLIPERPAIILDDETSTLVMTFDPENISPLGGTDGVGEAITAYYLGDPEDAILIWEEGMELPSPSAGGQLMPIVQE